MFKRIFFVVIFFLCFNSIFASHFMGGQITYNCIGTNFYEITLKLYRDCNGVEFLDPQERIRISVDGVEVGTLDLFLIDQADITTICPGEISKCTDPQSTYPFGVQEWIYQANWTAPAISQGKFYTLAHGRLARNGAITTCDMSANCPYTGWYITALLNPNISPCNSSPDFLNSPIGYICENEPFNYNHNAFDADGDSLVFSFTKCISSNFDSLDYMFGPPYIGTAQPIGPVCYLSPYRSTYPLSSVDDTVYINSQTGEISFIPDKLEVGIMSIVVQEYRNGIKIGEIIRDIQITVISCDNTIPKIAQFDINGKTDTTIYAFSDYCFTFSATDDDWLVSSDPNDYRITINITSGLGGTWSNPNPQLIYNKGSYCISPTCNDVREQPYLVTVIAEDDACPLPGISSETFEIYIIPPEPYPPNLYCVNPVSNDQNIKLQWEYPLRSLPDDKYKIFRAGKRDGPYKLIKTITNIQNLSYTDVSGSLNPVDSVYYYYIELLSKTCSGDSSMFTDTIANIQLSSNFNDPVLPFKWNSPVENVNLNYELQRKDKSQFEKYDTTSNLVYSDTTFSCTPMYLQHRIKVTDTTLNCTFYSNVVYDTIPAGAIPPARPSICMSNVNIDNSASLVSFSPGADSAKLKYLIIYRFNQATSLYDSVAAIGINKPEFVDSLIDASKSSYQYMFVAVDTCNLYSEPSDTHKTINVTGTPQFLSAKIDWNTYENFNQDSLKFVVYRSVGLPLNFTVLDTITDLTFTDTALSCTERYYYRVSTLYEGTAPCTEIFSDTTSIIPLDTVLPVAPLICNCSVGPNKIDIEVDISNVVFNDVVAVQLYFASDSSLLASYSIDSAIYTFVDTARLLTENPACYYAVSEDSCGNKSVPSPVFCSNKLNAKGGQGQVDLAWTDSSGYDLLHYIIYRNGDSIGISTTKSFIDSSMLAVCNASYYYQIEAVYKVTQCNVRFSDTSWATPYDSIIPSYPQFCILSVGNDKNDVFIEFDKSESADVVSHGLIRIAASGSNGMEKVFSKNDTLKYSDKDIITASQDQACYYLYSIDSCGNNSPNSPTYCTINLEADAGINKNFLYWTSFKVWQPDGYDIYAGNSFPLKLIASTTDTTFVHDSLQCMDNLLIYQVKAYRSDSTAGCHYSFSDTLSILCSEIDLPNVFTPNDDKIHNIFIPVSYQNVVSIDFKVFNRWGQLVSRSSDIDNLWDGKNIHNKKDCVEGTYFYIADVELKTYETANKLKFHGHITLLR